MMNNTTKNRKITHKQLNRSKAQNNRHYNKKMTNSRALIAKKRFISAFSLLFVLTCILCITMNVKGESTPKDKYFTSIKVESGDTLWKVAETYYTDDYSDYNEYIEEVKAINNMKDNNLKKGSYIVIPYYQD